MKFSKFFNLFLEGSAVRSYSCLMLDLSFLSADVCEIHNEICPCEVYNDEPGHGLEKETHVTVKYGLTEQSAYNVFNKIKLKPVKFRFSGLSLFENDKYDVLKFTVDSKDIHEMNKLVCDNFEYFDSYPTYIPHCTVAYLKPGTGKYYTKIKSPLIGEDFISNRYIFSSKDGDKVYYTVK